MMRAMNSSDRTGLLIVRLWMEGDVPEGFRARITQKLDAGTIEYTVGVAGTPADACEVVQKWVDAFVNSN
jgi:hypothetical protein